jgi:2-polyprenyl-3-methyl-5-hydroxy-6-metoxy-1,4-benzoquinol methylase
MQVGSSFASNYKCTLIWNVYIRDVLLENFDDRSSFNKVLLHTHPKMQDRHKNRNIYFEEQGITTKKYVIPYIKQAIQIEKGIRVLEIGCGEGGNLIPFIELNCEVVGIDLSKRKIEIAKQQISQKYANANVKLIENNIYDVSHDEVGTFDVIFLRDVIEHIPNQKRFMEHLKVFMKPNGVIFFGFPPWTMPFGGHQQICQSKLLSKLPYYHLLPSFLYKSILKLFGEKQVTIDALLEIKSTGIGINRFNRIVDSSNFQFIEKDFYLINPNYEVKFGLKPRAQFSIIRRIPYLRDFFTTCLYCLIKDKKSLTNQ